MGNEAPPKRNYIKELVSSAKEGNLEAIEALLQEPEAEVTVDTQDDVGRPPAPPIPPGSAGCCVLILLAISLLTASTLMAQGGRTALSYAAERGHTSTSIMLLDKGASVDLKSQLGWTPTMYTAWKGQPASLTELIKWGADVNETDCSGTTALMLAATKGHSDIASMLLEAGASVDLSDCHGRTALVWGAQAGQPAVLQQLVTAGADINWTTSNGRTALHWAVFGNKHASVEKLMNLGADTSIRDQPPAIKIVVPASKMEGRPNPDNGLTAAEHAKEKKYHNIAKFLNDFDTDKLAAGEIQLCEGLVKISLGKKIEEGTEKKAGKLKRDDADIWDDDEDDDAGVIVADLPEAGAAAGSDADADEEAAESERLLKIGEQPFIEAKKFMGSMSGYEFKTGLSGLGYYKGKGASTASDAVAAVIDDGTCLDELD